MWYTSILCQLRKRLLIVIKFEELGIDEQIVRSVSHMGFEEMTPIQEKTIPLALEGKDLIGQAQTGTGKTAAFGIPLIQGCQRDNERPHGLVLAPTRELAVQVAEELNKIGNDKGIRTLPIYGGQDISWQINALKKRPHIIVATPGRLMDHMRRKTIRLNEVQMVILDEADEMLNMGFVEDIETILQELPEERQTLLFSATMPRQIQNLAQRFMREPELIRIEAKEVTMPSIEQMYLEVPEKQKFDVLCRMMDINPTELVIVFGRTKRRVDELSEALSKRGYSAEGLHGDLTQNRRDIVLRKFKEGTIEVLVATDVAARGLDISGVSHVYNFDIPQDPESYVHRIGRTGRAGKTGVAITFVTPREIGHLHLIEQVIKRKIARKPVPSLVEAFKGQQQITVEKLMRVIEEEDIQKYRGMAEDLLEETDSVTLLSAALKLLTKEPDQGTIELSQEAPLRVRNFRPDPRDNRRNGGGPKSGDWNNRNKSGPNRSNNRGNSRRP